LTSAVVSIEIRKERSLKSNKKQRNRTLTIEDPRDYIMSFISHDPSTNLFSIQSPTLTILKSIILKYHGRPEKYNKIRKSKKREHHCLVFNKTERKK
jgi:hypothetical protein